MLAATTAVNGGLGYAYWILAARSMPPGGVGVATSFVAAITLVSLFANLGLGSALVTALPHRATPTAWSRAVAVAIIAVTGAGLLGGAMAVGVLALLTDELPLTAASVAGLVIGAALTTVATVVDFVFIAERRASFVLVRNAVLGVVKIMVLAGMLSVSDIGGIGLFGSWVLGLGVSVAVACLVLLPRLGRGWERPSLAHLHLRSELRRLHRPAAGNLLVSLPAQLPAYALPLVVVARASVTDTGLFGVGWMVVGLLGAISPAVAMSMFAEGSHGRDLRSAARTSGLFLAAVLVPSVLVVVIGRQLWLGLFGPAYPAAAAGLVVLLAIATLPDAVSNLYVAAMRVLERYRPAVIVNSGIALIALVGAWLLVPILGIDGAGWAWLGGQTVMATVVGADVVRRRARHATRSTERHTPEPGRPEPDTVRP